MAKRKRRVSAPLTYRSALEACHRRARSRASAIQTRAQLNHRVEPSTVEYDAGPARISHREIRLRNSTLHPQLSDWNTALILAVGSEFSSCRVQRMALSRIPGFNSGGLVRRAESCTLHPGRRRQNAKNTFANLQLGFSFARCGWREKFSK